MLYWRDFKFGRLRWSPIWLSVEVNITIISAYRNLGKTKGNWKYW